MNKKEREMHRKIMIGEKNPRWNGGVSEYPNHIKLKKMRIKVLKKAKGKCEICDNQANIVHHIDGDKGNHSIINLIPLCNPCHQALHKKEYGEMGNRSKYFIKYGMSLYQIGEKLHMSYDSVWQYLNNPNKKDYIENKIRNIINNNNND